MKTHYTFTHWSLEVNNELLSKAIYMPHKYMKAFSQIPNVIKELKTPATQNSG